MPSPPFASPRPGAVLVVGELNVDLVLSGCAGMPVPGQEILAEDFRITLGSASALCAVGLARLETPVAFAGKVGADAWGQFCVQFLRGRQVDVTRVVSDPGLKTGVTVAISDARDRALVTYPGSITAAAVDRIDADLFAGFVHLHVSSFFLQTGLRPRLRELFAAARAAGLTTSLDPGFDPDQKWDGGLRDVLAEVDVFFPNEVELAAIAGTSDVDAGLSRMDIGRTRVVAKLGARGAALREGGQMAWASPFAVAPLDTTGAGDSFNAGFLSAWLGGAEPAAAMRFASACGALSTLRPGGAEGQPTRAEVQAFLDAQAGGPS